MVTDMKKIVLIILFFNVLLFGQKEYYSVGAYGDYYVPVSGMADRFNPVFGGSISFGALSRGDWYWSGQLEYFSTEEGNTDKFKILRNVEVGGVDVPYELRFYNLQVKFELGGLSANTEYNFLNTSVVESSVKFGFGIYRWFYSRSAVYDTLYADTTGNGDMVAAANLQVPAVSQTDWSGGLNTGLVIKIKFMKPVLFYLNADYKVIIGEIYPALDLGLENISTFQFVNIKAGFRIRF